MDNMEGVKQEGKKIFQNFIVERIEAAGINQPTMYLGIEQREASSGGGYSNMDNEHRQVLDIDFNNINQERFLEILMDIFTQGFSTKKLYVLFQFCAYAIIKAIYENRAELGKLLFQWSLRFVIERICPLVFENGGWAKVLGMTCNVVTKALQIGALAVVIMVGIAYLKNNY